MQPVSDERRKIFTVDELTRRIRLTLEDEVGQVWVEGELSNVHPHTSGHTYFTLKDSQAQIQGALFRGDARGVTFPLKDGLKVRVFGQITAYTARSQYQIIARKIEEAGKGSLQEQFEKLKEKLAKEGLFDAARKKPIPLLPQRLGIVTSPTGAAIRDMLNVLSRRYPNLHIILAPVKVQGEGAAQDIAAAIDLFNELRNVDVLIVGRGGGSLEDLWAFNEEVVARAIARSILPVISAVGHEIDFTISDFVADLRAPTPSAAAELVVGQKDAFVERLRVLRRSLDQAAAHHLLSLQHRLGLAARSYVFREPQNLLRAHRQRIDLLRRSLAAVLQDAYAQQQRLLDELGLRLHHHAERSASAARQDIQRLTSQLRALNPLAVLERGYSVTRRADGTVLRKANDVEPGASVETLLGRGRITSTVDRIQLGKEAADGREEK